MPAYKFTPPPKVDSAVVRVTPLGPPRTPGFDSIEWDSMLKRCFMGRNKTLRSLFSSKHLLAHMQAAREGVMQHLHSAAQGHSTQDQQLQDFSVHELVRLQKVRVPT